MSPAHALLLVGSAKAAGTSTSEALGRYLLDRLAESGLATTVLNVNRTRRPAHDERLLAAVATADLLIVATPLYVDSLPYLLTRQLEVLHQARTATPSPRPCRMLALVNCGFPEARQCRTALAILRAFARDARFEWAGGLALGQGAAIDGRRLESIGAIGRGIRSALEIAAGALACGESVPVRAADLLARPMMPCAVYVMMAHHGWRRQAARLGARQRLADRPYERHEAGPR